MIPNQGKWMALILDLQVVAHGDGNSRTELWEMLDVCPGVGRCFLISGASSSVAVD